MPAREATNPESYPPIRDIRLRLARPQLCPWFTFALIAAWIARIWFEQARPWAGATAFISPVAFPFLLLLDRSRRGIWLRYELDSEYRGQYTSFSKCLASLSHCGKVEHKTSQQDVDDPKYHAGADTLFTSNKVTFDAAAPDFLFSNLTFRVLEAGERQFCFLPDAILIINGSHANGVAYRDLTWQLTTAIFPERNRVPTDAIREGTTWRYVNKDGSPDGRFNDNSEIPLMRYAEIRLRSRYGLDETFIISDVQAAKGLGLQLTQMSEHMERLRTRTPRIETRAGTEPSNMAAMPHIPATGIISPSVIEAPPLPANSVLQAQSVFSLPEDLSALDAQISGDMTAKTPVVIMPSASVATPCPSFPVVGAMPIVEVGLPAEPQTTMVGAAARCRPTRTSGMAILSLVAGIVGLFLPMFVLSIIAIISGVVGLRRTKDQGTTGKGIAIAGLTLGAVGTCLSILLTVNIVLLVTEDRRKQSLPEQGHGAGIPTSVPSASGKGR